MSIFTSILFFSQTFGFHRNWFVASQPLMFSFKQFPSSINASSGVWYQDIHNYFSFSTTTKNFLLFWTEPSLFGFSHQHHAQNLLITTIVFRSSEWIPAMREVQQIVKVFSWHFALFNFTYIKWLCLYLVLFYFIWIAN